MPTPTSSYPVAGGGFRVDVYRVHWAGGALTPALLTSDPDTLPEHIYLSHGPSTNETEFIAADVVADSGDDGSVDVAAGDYDMQCRYGADASFTPVLVAGLTFVSATPAYYPRPRSHRRRR